MLGHISRYATCRVVLAVVKEAVGGSQAVRCPSKVVGLGERLVWRQNLLVDVFATAAQRKECVKA